MWSWAVWAAVPNHAVPPCLSDDAARAWRRPQTRGANAETQAGRRESSDNGVSAAVEGGTGRPCGGGGAARPSPGRTPPSLVGGEGRGLRPVLDGVDQRV